MTLGILQFFRYFEMPITVEKGSNVSQTVETTSDFVPTIEQYRSMNIGDLRSRVILSMGLDLSWRVSDFIEIRKTDLPDLNGETPLPFDKITEKEKVLAKSFLSAETVELLKVYVPTLKPENPFLFQSNGQNHLDAETIGDVIKNLARKANIVIPKGKILRFHAFRKRFLATCADLKIDVNTAKILVGKNVESSMLAYLSEVNHSKAFLEIKSVLNLTNGRLKATVDAKDVEIEKLKRQNDNLQRQIEILANLLKKELLEEASKNIKGVMEPNELKPVEILRQLAQDKEIQDRIEYEKMLKNGNGNGA